MTVDIDTTTIATFVAIDIAKHRHDVIIKQGESAAKSFRVANTLEDFERFSTYLRSLPSPLQFGFEPTANYHRNIGWHLLQKGYDMRLVSSVACARTREAVD